MSETKPPSDPTSGPASDAGTDSDAVPDGDNFTKLATPDADDGGDIGIEKPPPDASYYDYDDGNGNLKLVLMGVGAVLVAAMIVGFGYLAYIKGVEDGQSSMPPMITAETAPVKTPPPGEATAGRPEEGPLNIYDILKNKGGEEEAADDAAGAGAPVMDEKEAEGDGSIESLMAEVMELEAETPATGPVKGTEDREGLAGATAAPKPAARPAPVPMAASEGAYMVQLVSVRTAREADLEFARIANKNKPIIGEREPLIKEVDLGERGVFFRVNIAGFETTETARNFCNQLKENGQDCLVVKAAQ